MKSFLDFMAEPGLYALTQLTEEKAIVSSGPKGERHLSKYIQPYLPGQPMHNKIGTHSLRVDLPGAPAGTKVPLLRHRAIQGVHHVVVKAAGKEHILPVSKLSKPVQGKNEANRGNVYEKKFTEHLRKHGLMKGGGAGSTAGHDFHLINKKKDTVHHGQLAGQDHGQLTIAGETKKSLHALFGQTGVHWNKEQGWHVPEHLQSKKPHVAAQIKKEGVLNLLNKHHPNGIEAGQKVQLKSEKTGLDHIHAYTADHGVDVLHVGGGKHGTYRVGLSQKHDRTGIGLPLPHGHGHYEIRNKEGGKNLTVEFRADHVDPSHTDLEKEEHIQRVKKALGHTS